MTAERDFFYSPPETRQIRDELRRVGPDLYLGPAMLERAARGHRTLCLGQGAELAWARDPEPLSSLQVLAIFREKTSPAFQVALELGAAAAGADQTVFEVLAAFSDALGAAYQIRDDLDDLDPEKAGDSTGADPDDLRAMRPTLPLAVARERAKGDDKALLDEIWRRQSVADSAAAEARLDRLRAIINDTGAADRCQSLLESYKDEAVRALQPLVAQPGMISLGGGMPNPSTFPFTKITASLRDGSEIELGGARLEASLQYSPTLGLPSLRAHLQALQEAEHGVTGRQVCVTTGSADALSKAFDALLLESVETKPRGLSEDDWRRRRCRSRARRRPRRPRAGRRGAPGGRPAAGPRPPPGRPQKGAARRDRGPLSRPRRRRFGPASRARPEVAVLGPAEPRAEGPRPRRARSRSAGRALRWGRPRRRPGRWAPRRA